MNDDKLLLDLIDDKKARCEDQYVVTSTGFLSSHEVAVAGRFLRSGSGPRALLYGGYEDAERRLCIFLPDYVDEADFLAGEDNPLRILRVSCPRGSRPLSHKDYLGSILALGLKRDVIGDIIVCENGADIIIAAEMADFLVMNYTQAGHTSLTASVLPVQQLRLAELKTETVHDTVASLRLDNIAASAFQLSRGKAQEAILRGLVFLNGLEETRPDASISEGDKLVLRGKGKVILNSVGGRSRKDRICITLTRYK